MRARSLALLVTLLLVATSCDWVQWGGSPAHSGSVSESSLAPGALAGLVSSAVAQLPTSAQAVTSGGLVFEAQDGKLTAFDAATYAVVWTGSLPSGSTAGGALAVDQASGTVFVVVAGAGPLILGFDVNGVKNCNTLLNFCSPKFLAAVGTAAGSASPLLLADGKVFANGGTTVSAFDAAGQTNCGPFFGAQACSPLWSAQAGGSASTIGPAVTGTRLFDAVNTQSGPGIGAFDTATGALSWSAPTGGAITAPPTVGAGGNVFVPVSGTIKAFAAGGCGAPTCQASYSLVPKTGDPAGSFLDSPAIDGSKVYATNANGRLYVWPEGGCGAPTCQPAVAVTVNAPTGGSTAYGQSPLLATGTVFLLAQRVVSGTNHVVLVALDAGTGAEIASWDLKAGGFGAGRANASAANGVVYAPVDSALYAVHHPAVEPLASLSASPLTLSPAFSPSIHDYVVRCAAGTNSLTIAMTAKPGGSVRLVAPTATQPSPSQSVPVQLAENQAAVVEAADASGATAQYWIRCLPADFPAITVTAHPAAGTPTPGWYLAGNLGGPQTEGPYAMILDGHGTPVWYRRAAQGTALNVTPVARNTVGYMSNLALQGFITDPNATFDIYSLDTGATEQVRTVGTPTDLHEFQTLPNGDHLMFSYPLKRGVDLTGLPGNPAPGPNSTIADCEIQDVNPGGQLVWQWRASDHTNIVAENQSPGMTNVAGETVYDVFHCNSIDATPSGDLLVSLRHFSSVDLIRRSDGKILWKLGGNPVVGDGAQLIQVQNDPGFHFQHDARLLPNGDVTLFDNEGIFFPPARAIEYALNFTTGTAQQVFQYVKPDGHVSLATGNFRRYSDGDSVICWGVDSSHNGALLTEIDSAGNDLLDISFGAPSASYRAVKAPPTRLDVNVLRQTAGH